MFEKRINVLGKSSSSATKRTLRQYRGVKRMSEVEYEQARIAYNREVNTRKKNIKAIENSLDNQLRNFTNGFTFDLGQVHRNYNNIGDFIQYLLNRITTILPDTKLMITMGDTTYTLTADNKTRLLRQLMNAILVEEQGSGSDAELIQSFNVMSNFTLEPFVPSNQRDLASGRFFPYVNKTKYDLSRYGIFKEAEYDYTICFLEALIAGGLSADKMELLKTMINHSSVPKSRISDICDKLHIKIVLRQDGQKNNYTFGTNNEEVYNLGLIEDHYFIFETTNNTRYSLEHYEEIKEHPRANEIAYLDGTKYKYDPRKKINSMDLFRILLENKNKLIEPYSYTQLSATPYFKKYENEFTTLEYNDKDMKPIKNDIADKISKSNEKDDAVNIFADFETLVYGDYHEPYLCCYSHQGVSQSFMGSNCGQEMLFKLSNLFKSVRLIFHNATYDYQFLVKHLYQFSQICRGTHLLTAKGMFNKMKVEIKCSYNLISSPLKKFGEMFKLDQEKEVMPYSIYTKANVDKKYLSIDEVVETISKPKDKTRFVDNINKWCLRRRDNTFDIIEYSRLYCVMDCIVLENGYNTFRKWIMDLEYIIDDNGNTSKCNLDINHIITSASLAHKYMILSGCYEGVYELNGVPQRFIQKSVVGGRTMMANNEKDYVNKNYAKTKTFKKISDFDGVSLYPSAMSRMTGFLRGKPNVLQTTDYNTILNYDGYFVEIKIHNIPIKRRFPLTSEKNEDGVRIFSNEIHNNLIVDKIQLEDLIQFHGLSMDDFTILRGYYFNDGFNNRINKAIRYLFETRKQKKREDNPSQEIYKLIMNSAYGKSIMKEITTETTFFDCYTTESINKYNSFISRHYNWIEKIVSVYDSPKKIVHLIKPIDDHTNIAQVGSSVLSWSKRIMNEVMCLAEDLGIEVFYQDTDSMHLYDENIVKLSNQFKAKYNRELIGEELGQFHTDFDIKYEDENGKVRKCKDVYSRRLIMLGKKCYIDELVGIDHECKERVSYHARMKGVSGDALEYACQMEELDNLIGLYEDLYKGKTISFDLCCGGKKAVFKYSGSMSVQTLPTFIRDISFS
jgi:hypothetical protein